MGWLDGSTINGRYQEESDELARNKKGGLWGERWN